MPPKPGADLFNSDISMEERLDVGGQDDEIEDIWREEQSRTLEDDGGNISVWEGDGNIAAVGSFEGFLEGGWRDKAV